MLFLVVWNSKSNAYLPSLIKTYFWYITYRLTLSTKVNALDLKKKLSIICNDKTLYHDHGQALWYESQHFWYESHLSIVKASRSWDPPCQASALKRHRCKDCFSIKETKFWLTYLNKTWLKCIFILRPYLSLLD